MPYSKARKQKNEPKKKRKLRPAILRFNDQLKVSAYIFESEEEALNFYTEENIHTVVKMAPDAYEVEVED